MPGTWLKPYEGKGALRGFLVSRVVFAILPARQDIFGTSLGRSAPWNPLRGPPSPLRSSSLIQTNSAAPASSTW